MTNPLSELQQRDPSNVNGWLISLVAGVSAFLIQLQPALDGVDGWRSAAFVVLFAALPKIQGWLTAKDAYKPDTVDAIAFEAQSYGESLAMERARAGRLEAAQKGAAKRKAKRTENQPTETSSDPKPNLVKRSKAKSKTATKPTRTTAK